MTVRSWGFRETRQQRQRQVRNRLVIAIFIAGLAIGSALFAYQVGTLQAQKPIATMRQEVEALQAEVETLNQQNQDLTAAREEAAVEAARLSEALPQGEAQTLLALIQERLGEGVATERLAFVLGAVRATAVCDEQEITKRFLVRTPLYDGENVSVSFGAESVTVSAEGENALNAEGKAEAWYDPAKAVTLTFADKGGESREASGTLPLSQTVVVAGHEYRFTATAGPQGFVKVSGLRCLFP